MTETKTKIETKSEVKEDNSLDKKVLVKNIAGWAVGFVRINTLGDVTIPADSSIRLSRDEIISQVNNSNKLFTGVNGDGNHATLFIDDSFTRREVGFDSEDGTIRQKVITDETVKNLFNSKCSQSTFETNFKELVKTRAEKYAVTQAIRRLKINDYSRMRFAEDYTGYKL